MSRLCGLLWGRWYCCVLPGELSSWYTSWTSFLVVLSCSALNNYSTCCSLIRDSGIRNLGVTVFLISSLDHYQRKEKIIKIGSRLQLNVSITKCSCADKKQKVFKTMTKYSSGTRYKRCHWAADMSAQLPHRKQWRCKSRTSWCSRWWTQRRRSTRSFVALWLVLAVRIWRSRSSPDLVEKPSSGP